MSNARKSRFIAPAVLAVTCWLLVPASAQAVEVSVQEAVNGKTYLFVDGTSGPDTVNIAPNNFGQDFALLVSDPVPGPGCTQTFGTIYCPGADVEAVQVDLGEGEDGLSVSNNTPDRPMFVYLGDDDDATKDIVSVTSVTGTYYIEAGGGDDDVSIAENTKPSEIWAGPGRDIVTGGTGSDLVHAESGDDLVRGHNGDDRLELGDGADKADGGSGFDRIDGGPGNDTIGAGPDEDIVNGGPGTDVVGSDHVVSPGLTLQLQQPSGNDEIFLRDGEFDRLVCGGGSDVVHADGGDDVARAGAEACERLDLPAVDAEDQDDSTPPPTPTPAPLPPPPPPPAPVVHDHSPAKQSLPTDLRRGVAFSVQTEGPGSLRLQLLDRRSRVVGSLTKSVASASSVKGRIALTRRARRALRRLAGTTLTLRCTLTNTAGASATASRKIVLRR